MRHVKARHVRGTFGKDIPLSCGCCTLQRHNNPAAGQAIPEDVEEAELALADARYEVREPDWCSSNCLEADCLWERCPEWGRH